MARNRITEADLKRCGMVVPKAKKKQAAPVQNPQPRFMWERWSLTVAVPTAVKSEANSRDHWAAKNRRKKDQWDALDSAMEFLCEGGLACQGSLWQMHPPLVVTWTHIGRKMDRHENLPMSFKGLTDRLSILLELDDGREDLVTWKYEQRPGKPGVELRIEKVSA